MRFSGSPSIILSEENFEFLHLTTYIYALLLLMPRLNLGAVYYLLKGVRGDDDVYVV